MRKRFRERESLLWALAWLQRTEDQDGPGDLLGDANRSRVRAASVDAYRRQRRGFGAGDLRPDPAYIGAEESRASAASSGSARRRRMRLRRADGLEEERESMLLRPPLQRDEDNRGGGSTRREDEVEFRATATLIVAAADHRTQVRRLQTHGGGR